MFKNHQDAGQKLALALEKYKNKKDVIVLAIPRGGVEIGYQVASYLNLDLQILVSRKLHTPENPEFGFGGMAEDGSVYIHPDVKYGLSTKVIDQAIAEQKEEIKKRITNLRNNKSLPSLIGKTVILVDDGVAMGVTMQSAIMMCRNQQVKKIVIAVPIGPKSFKKDIKNKVDEIIILETPFLFSAVAQGYEEFHNFTDQEVWGIMERWKKGLKFDKK